MVHWVYILECEGNRTYVGETRRLFRRFWEHNSGRGGVNTCRFTPRNIVALYKVQTIGRFMRYNQSVTEQLEVLDNDEDYSYYRKQDLMYFDSDHETLYNHLDAENAIVHCLAVHNPDNWPNVRGGKYTMPYGYYPRPNIPELRNLPLCHCGYPCDIKKNSDKGYLFFRCAKKNMWDGFRDVFDVMDEPCKFYQEYTLDSKFRAQAIKERKEVAKHCGNIVANSTWLGHMDECEDNTCVLCQSETYKPIVYDDIERNVCTRCFFGRYGEVEALCKPKATKSIATAWFS
jgi:predicted GIY-YIG superfamily endonuclease